MLEKLKQIVEVHVSEQWRDTRMWTFVVFGVVVLLASWSGVRVIETNYELQKKIAKLEQQNEVIQLQNRNQTLKNQYLESDTYLELAARKQFGKAAPGETLVIVPQQVSYANASKLSNKPVADGQEQSDDANEPFYARNLNAWRNFVFAHKL